MSDPCTEKENINKLFELHAETKDIVQEMRVVQAKIEGDVSHTRARIENGMSTTISKINENLNKVIPLIESHEKFIDKLREIGWFIFKAGIVGAFFGGIYWAVAHKLLG